MEFIATNVQPTSFYLPLTTNVLILVPLNFLKILAVKHVMLVMQIVENVIAQI